MPHLERDGAVLLLDLGADENRFTMDWIAEVNAALDQAIAAEGSKALVTKARGKFFSNGLDLDWLAANPDRRGQYLGMVQELFARILEFPMPTVCAVQGHCFAGGAMLQLAHDHTVMRADRGFWCLPEVHLRMPFSTGMTALVIARLPVRAIGRELSITRRTASSRNSGLNLRYFRDNSSATLRIRPYPGRGP